MMRTELKVVGGKHEGQIIPLNSKKFLIGREQDCHLRPSSELVSRHHCVFSVDEYGARLRDLGSTNGTLVNDKRVQGEISLNPGDIITVGKLVFELVITEISDDQKKSEVVNPDILAGHISGETSELSSADTVYELSIDQLQQTEKEQKTDAEATQQNDQTPQSESVSQAEPAQQTEPQPVAAVPESVPAQSSIPAQPQVPVPQQPVPVQQQPVQQQPMQQPMMPYPQQPNMGYPQQPNMGYPQMPQQPMYGYPQQPMPYQQPMQQPIQQPMGVGNYPVPPQAQPEVQPQELSPGDSVVEVILPDPASTGAKPPEPKVEEKKDGDENQKATTENPSTKAADIIKNHMIRRPGV